MSRVCCISDLHGYLPEDIEPCDIVLICGDISPLMIQFKTNQMWEWLNNEFKPWAFSLPCKKVLFIPGNHDAFFESRYSKAKELFPNEDKVTYLCDELYEFEGIRIWGTPYCKVFGTWPFMRYSSDLKKHFGLIPECIDILMTHDAPYGTSDIILQDMPWNTGEHIGNLELRDAILEKSPKYNVHGHLHSTNHEWERLEGTMVINCSLNDENYEVTYSPIYFNI